MVLLVDLGPILWYYESMNRKHQRTLEAIFSTPVRASINWKDIESLFNALGAEIEEGKEDRESGYCLIMKRLYFIGLTHRKKQIRGQ